ncbi:MAG: error-prone DNA polymerase [Pseudomonadales bacterium]|jgi:error-prone DNA polymerase|nr:error-prone DNA polymerase [Pseudomonadales bacterium]MDP6473065.1 error-prone DNA polymerase [Pseudomonadales bacterium]MDP6826178.1 error-prone DNA polymerase [Pseudomonadales bacterium]MDP6973445.1 error-prone DNA polymerase [Pseudomonadales bacterium]
MATSVNQHPPPEDPDRRRVSAFAELHALSNFSFLEGASHPEELVEQAASLGYSAIALTDICSFAGLVKAHMAAKEHGIHLIIGAHFDLEEGIRLILLAPTRSAYGQLAGLITCLKRRSPKGEYYATLDDFRWGCDECLALWAPNNEDIQTLIEKGRKVQSRFEHLWIALELLREQSDLDKTANALTLSTHLDLPIVASNDVRAHIAARQPLQDVMSAVRLKTTVAELKADGFGNAERHLRSIGELETLYPPEMLVETLAIARRCTFSMDELRYEYPEELVPPHLTPHEYLRQLTLSGAAERWPDGIPHETLNLLESELELVRELEYEYYFLTVQDIVQFARSQGILCQGRGSAANSAVCYCLHITEVDPSRMHLLFERFVSKERDEPPDIDVDFEHERREEVIQYIYKRYGRDRAALAATVITYRPKSAIRDVGKALGMDLDLVDLLAKSLAWWDRREELGKRFRAAGLDPDRQLARQFLYLVEEIMGFPRHLSQHVGGFVISRGPLAQLVPVENASMDDRTVIQWDKDDLEALGLLKVDVLGLGMLTAIRKTLAMLNAYRGTDLGVSSIPPEDPATYRMLQKGDSIGVFQVESRAQMSMLPRLKPQHFYDLVIEVAIVRPGPIQGDMVHPYLRRRQGLEEVTYSDDAVRRVLERTLGIPIFQEQVIELAMVAAGFSGGEADQLRRAMAAWKRRGGLEKFEQKLIDGMLERGHDQEFAERIFKQIQGFGEYGFPESHAASFALMVYVSAWLKRHEPAAFYCGLLNSLPMGFYSPSQLIQDAKRHGIEIRSVDVQRSCWDHHLEPPASDGQPAVRMGLRLIKGLAEDAGLAIEASRPFTDTEDLAQCAGLNRQTLEFLARAGALENLSGHRYQAHWDVAAAHAPTALQVASEQQPEYETSVSLPGPGDAENVLDDYRYLSLSLGPHPLALLRERLGGFSTAADLERCRHGQFVQVAGIVTGRQRPGTATGVLFVTLEDESGNLNIVVWSSVFDRFRAALLQGRLLKIKGVMEREAEVIHVVAGQVTDATCLLGELASRKDIGAAFNSRDFH